MKITSLTGRLLILLEASYGPLSEYSRKRLEDYGSMQEGTGPDSMTASYRRGHIRQNFPFSTALVDAVCAKGSMLSDTEMDQIFKETLNAVVKAELNQMKGTRLPG